MNIARSLPRPDLDPAWLLRIFTAIPVVVVLLAGAVAIWIYFFALSLLPQGESLVETQGLAAEVLVVRDRNGIPGIIGEKEEDVALVLGYVMAQDRLWQMDFLRRAGQGRLAEILGADYLQYDQLIRTVRVQKEAQSFRNRLDERQRLWLDRFIQGVNKYIARHSSKLPLEFSLLEYQPAAFTAEDVEHISAGLAWAASAGARIDPLMARVLGHVGKDLTLELIPADPAAVPAFLASDLIGWKPKGLLFAGGTSRRALQAIPALTGGCAWAVGPNRTQSGKSLLGCTVYQTLTAPGFWYRARLVAGDFQLSGSFIPGVPVALSGAAGNLAWSAVHFPADDADLFLERLDSDDSANFWRVDRWRRVEEVRESCRVRGGSSLSLPIRFTETGPIVSEVDKGRALSLRWTGRDGSGLFETFFAVNRARNGKEAAIALKSLVSPCLNLVWADQSGNFGIQAAGRVPVRAAGSDGILPMPAWTGVHDWNGYIPFHELPSVTNPSGASCAAADERPGGPDYPFFVSCYWTDEGRFRRIQQLLAGVQDHSRDSFQRMMGDTVSPVAGKLAPVIVKALDQARKKSGSEDEALRLLAAWDCRMAHDSAGAAVFGLVYQALVEELFAKPLGEDLAEGVSSQFLLASRMVTRIFVDGKTAWLQGADPKQVVAAAFHSGVARGRSLMGADPRKWKWGAVHTVEFNHPLAVRSRFLEALYDVGPVPVGGFGDSVNFAAAWKPRSLEVSEGVSLRHVAEMAEPPVSYSISPLGESSHFFSTHYKDQTSAWLRDRSTRDPVQTSEIRKSGMTSVRFKPAATAAVSMKMEPGENSSGAKSSPGPLFKRLPTY